MNRPQTQYFTNYLLTLSFSIFILFKQNLKYCRPQVDTVGFCVTDPDQRLAVPFLVFPIFPQKGNLSGVGHDRQNSLSFFDGIRPVLGIVGAVPKE